MSQPASSDISAAWPPGRGLETARAALESQGTALLGGVEGAGRAFALARLWLDAPRVWLVVCPTLATAETLAKDLDFFLAGAVEGGSPVRLFPAYEVSPYQELDPPPEVTARRLSVLWELMAEQRPLVVVTSAAAAASRLCPPEHLLDNYLSLSKGQRLERDALVKALAQGGYTPVPLVEQVGDFALRGSVVDFFGPLLDEPVRVEFFGDEVESLRRFDPADQRSQLPLPEAALIPCLPVDLSVDAADRAVKRLRKLAREEGLSTRRLAELVDKIELRAPFTGLESLLPMYFGNAGDLFSYLPDEAWHVVLEPAEVALRLENQSAELQEQFDQAREEGRVVLGPPMLRRTPEQMSLRLDSRPHLHCRALAMGLEKETHAPLVKLKASTFPGLHQELKRGGEGSIISRFLEWVGEQEQEGRATVLVCRSRSQVQRLAELLAEREVGVRVRGSAAETWPADPGGPSLSLMEGGLTAGFAPAEIPVVFITEDEVLGAPRVVRHKAPPRLSEMLAALDDLEPGDLVVHMDHGVARYEGLTTVAVGAAESDFLHLVFAGNDKLYMPADRMGLISKYRGPEDAKPKLDRLGGYSWARAKGRAKKAVELIAQDLVELYAARSVAKGKSFTPPDGAFREFETGFPWEETPDQARAIEDVLADLGAARPMDRLICGDVGFGKTEVALRAAYLVAMQGKQVAFLVPTTVLAEQHYQTFVERLVDQPLEVESLSRFKTPAEQRKVLAGIKDGTLDIVVGTHRLIQKDVEFKDLGLVVVDEEQRFGVKDKERLKKLRRLVDVLTLTATPIPRTLQMSLSGLRDLSVINTPPADRQAIKTYVAPFTPQAVREALERELERGGQVFLVHNRVQDIGKMARLVRKLTPAARVGVAHGQLPEKELERVMMAFVKKELDVLVCTTIIESGLDIPAANTIIINRAEKLGLSQIYQLRGRVGRSGQRAYAYLLVKSEQSLSRQAAKRLKALMDFTQLGAGFAIAMHDLQIRGAGNMLGEAQSGVAAEVGYELYLRLLEEAIARLKGEAPAEGPEPELKLGLPAHLPESYVPDPEVRLSLYRRLSAVRRAEDLEGVAAEMGDRFGPPPAAAGNLLAGVGLKVMARRLGAERLDISGDGFMVHFTRTDSLDLDRLLTMAQDQPHKVRVFPDGRVKLNLEAGSPPLEQARQFLQYIGGDGN
ncbi:MAG: transcription-repair coupling factor [Desulfarculaceae bacterium]|nr:transcription-repair coupling factor [Desulfarculaceae bacterium]MCF8071798.1 transcription-repair coupling factor [Desulfarculaceae bacterium]MCF8101348.1 transcription-repair coupling factor [Desulfarculaceae bacterium]MCF8117191.1 transcription-repair coupling factor [Desulfarculaceae bacterium]